MQVPKHSRRTQRRGSLAVDVLLWAAAFGTVAATIAYSLGPAPAALNAFPLADKLFHAAAYGAMTFTWLLAAVWRPGRGGGVIAADGLAVVIFAVLLGGAIEIGQHFVHRSADWFDAVADAVGAVAGYLLWVAIRSLGRGAARE
jgi:VanZ family protein